MSKAGHQPPGLDRRHRDAAGEISQKRSNVLGLRAFEKISAVEGVHLSGEMRRDVKTLSDRPLSAVERTRFITGKYGKK